MRSIIKVETTGFLLNLNLDVSLMYQCVLIGVTNIGLKGSIIGVRMG